MSSFGKYQRPHGQRTHTWSEVTVRNLPTDHSVDISIYRVKQQPDRMLLRELHWIVSFRRLGRSEGLQSLGLHREIPAELFKHCQMLAEAAVKDGSPIKAEMKRWQEGEVTELISRAALETLNLDRAAKQPLTADMPLGAIESRVSSYLRPSWFEPRDRWVATNATFIRLVAQYVEKLLDAETVAPAPKKRRRHNEPSDPHRLL